MSKKYVLVDNIPRVNELVEEGYKVHSVTVHTYREDMSGSIVSKDQYLMSLSSEKAYDNITNLVDIPPNQVDEYLEDGWIVADSWSKVVRMVKKAEPDE